jgi:hypothetical protein
MLHSSPCSPWRHLLRSTIVSQVVRAHKLPGASEIQGRHEFQKQHRQTSTCIYTVLNVNILVKCSIVLRIFAEYLKTTKQDLKPCVKFVGIHSNCQQTKDSLDISSKDLSSAGFQNLLNSWSAHDNLQYNTIQYNTIQYKKTIQRSLLTIDLFPYYLSSQKRLNAVYITTAIPIYHHVSTIYSMVS